jgi:hypothetical protein
MILYSYCTHDTYHVLYSLVLWYDILLVIPGIYSPLSVVPYYAHTG